MMVNPYGLLCALHNSADDLVLKVRLRYRSGTARIVVQASLTGHLVFATLHTNDAVSAVARLVDMGVERFLLGKF